MNYIHQLQKENKEMREALADLQNQINTMLVYYSSPKFQGFKNDYAHITTDIFPKLVELRNNAYLHIREKK